MKSLLSFRVYFTYPHIPVHESISWYSQETQEMNTFIVSKVEKNYHC